MARAIKQRQHNWHLIIWFVVLEAVAIATLYFSGIAMTSVDGFYKGLTAFAIIALGLTLPYWLLKILMHVAHSSNPEEKELKLTDLPKDQRVVRRKRASSTRSHRSKTA